MDMAEDVVDLSAVVYGRTDLGRPATVPLVDGHLLLTGATRAGKSSCEWAILGAAAPAIISGRFQPWGIDPKGNELALGRGLFTRYARPQLDRTGEITEDTARPMVDLLMDAAHVALARGDAMSGHHRKHVPTPTEPAIGLFVDEIVWFQKVMPFPELRRDFNNAFGMLLSQGASAGVTLVVSTQDARKEIVPARHFFARRLQFRCAEAEEVKWSLGDTARDRGARADEIPETAQGVHYAVADGSREIIRARPYYWDDPAVVALAETVAAKRAGIINTTARPAVDLTDDLDEDPFDLVGAVA